MSYFRIEYPDIHLYAYYPDVETAHASFPDAEKIIEVTDGSLERDVEAILAHAITTPQKYNVGKFLRTRVTVATPKGRCDVILSQHPQSGGYYDLCRYRKEHSRYSLWDTSSLSYFRKELAI